MECKPQVSKETYKDMTPSDKLNILYDMQVVTMGCVEVLDQELKKRKLFDRGAIFVGAAVGGLLGALGINLGAKG